MAAPDIFDELLWARRVARLAPARDVPDFLLQRVAEDLTERLSIVRRSFRRIAVFGDYQDVLARRLRLATGCEDIDSVPRQSLSSAPLPSEQYDLIVSGLSLQLINDVPGVLAKAQRALRPDGLFLAALLGGATLHELRTAWLVAEEDIMGGASPRVAPFADVRDLGALLQRAKFALPVADSDRVEVTYATPLQLMQDIKAMGASNMLTERRRVPVTRRLLLRAAEVYADRFSRPDGRVTATFEIMTLTGWAPHESQQKPLEPGSATMRLEEALRANPKDREAKE